MSNATTLIVMWSAVALVGIAGATAALVWAVRSRQFSDQERARFLPLDSDGRTDIPVCPPEEKTRVPN